jgi:hypothetical protein
MEKTALCQSYDVSRECLLDPCADLWETKVSVGRGRSCSWIGDFGTQTREEFIRRSYMNEKEAVRNNLIDLMPSYYYC